MTDELNVDTFRVDIGRADRGRSFIRVVHIPTGKNRIVVGLEGANPDEVVSRLTGELAKEIDAERLGPNPPSDLPSQ